MARSRQLGIKNGDDVRSIISLEGRPVSLSASSTSDGSALQPSGSTTTSQTYKISAISKDINAVITFPVPSQLQVGDSVTISGATGGSFTGVNGVRTVAALISDTRISINVNSSGYSGDYKSNSATISGDLAFEKVVPTYSSLTTIEIPVDVGRAVYVDEISITTNIKCRLSGVIAQDAQSQWIGSGNQDSYELGSDGGYVPLGFNGLILGSGSRVTLQVTPYPEAGQTDPDIGLRINGIEFTADFNFGADKRLLYCGDSISWSLLGNWKPQDLGYNYSGNKRQDSLPFPNYFGDELAAFRLVNALRKKSTPESIRLVNKGFGGSRLSSDQWFAMRSGLYNSVPWSLMVMQAGINDATDVQTPLRQLTMGQRIDDMVAKRDNDGLSDYPMVFCTAPATDDRYGGSTNQKGLDSRVCLDLRNPIDGEVYDATIDSGSDTSINFGAIGGNRWIKVEGNGSNDLTITGGDDANGGAIYRIDFTTDATILTGIANASTPYPYVITLESLRNIGEIASDGKVEIDAGTTLFIRCKTTDQEYEEVDRVRLIGSNLPVDASTFDANNSDGNLDNHFIANLNTTRTQIIGADVSGISSSQAIQNAVTSRNLTQFNFGGASSLSPESLPPASNIENNDVWIQVTGLEDTSAPDETSWADLNGGFYKVVNYSIGTNGNIGNFQVALDTRDGIKRKFDGEYVSGTGTVTLLYTRPYIAQFEGNSLSNTSNCSFFDNGDNTIGNYTFRVQLKSTTTAPFDLVAGKGICFSVYQQGNIIFMNEIASGDITNTGKIVGGDNLTDFYTQQEVGLTRIRTVNKIISDTVNAYGDSANVHLVDLYDIDDLAAGNVGVGNVPVTTESDAGRLQYANVDYKTGSSEPLRINDPIEDPIFKATGNSGTNERVMGKRLHRSPKGHEEIFNRLWSVIEPLTIPN